MAKTAKKDAKKTDLAKILKKVDGLIARTSSDSDAEARTSALLACNLIRKHGLRVVPEGAQPLRAGDEAVQKTEGAEWWEEAFDRTWEATAEAVRVDPGRRGDDVRIFKARYPGKCAHCNKGFRAGAKVASFPKKGKGKGLYHDRCTDFVK